MKRQVLTCAVMIVAASTAFGQSLAEIAKKEKERRKHIDTTESRTVTDVELRRVGGPRELSTSSTLSNSSSDSEDGEEGVAEQDLEDDQNEIADQRQTEDYWRGRLSPIDARIQALEQRLQSPQFTSNPIGAPDRERVEGQLAAARAERQAVVDEARRKGVPPGWLR